MAAPVLRKRPAPPSGLVVPGDLAGDTFVACDDLRDWIVSTFIDGSGRLINQDHEHLRHAAIGCLWTNMAGGRQGRAYIGTAEQPQPAGKDWRKGRGVYQLVQWFGAVPDFVLTFYAPWWAQASDAEICAVAEHELYHCAQKRDAFGAPKFGEDGRPQFTLRGHDVEEFVGVVRRYGAVHADVKALVDAAGRAPEVRGVDISGACGTCHLKVA